MIAFVVHGIPQPAGSKKGFFIPKLHRVVITDDAKKSRPWKALVSDAAAQAMAGQAMLTAGALMLTVRFFMPRPKGHFGRRGLLPSAPAFPAVKPDCTKLLRAVEDAINGIVLRDDAQIVYQVVSKEYGEPARAEVEVAPMPQSAAAVAPGPPVAAQAGLFGG